jgi:hypothetical protein
MFYQRFLSTYREKKMKSLMKITLCICGLAASSGVIANNEPLSLSNLERERAALVKDLLDPSLDFEARLVSIDRRQRQLTDMERMVIRDERLLSSTSPTVKRAFEKYELTFLVHAGAENNQSATAQWLEQVNFSSESVLRARAGYR